MYREHSIPCIVEITYVYIHDFMITVVVHLKALHQPRRQFVEDLLTSSESFELPHPSINIRALLFGIMSRNMSATSAYDLNQSNEVSSDSLSYNLSQTEFLCPLKKKMPAHWVYR